MWKVWEKAGRDERTSIDTKISDGDLIARKAFGKLAEAAEELEDEIDAYQRTHNVREITSTEKAFKTIQTFIERAQEELGAGYAWLDNSTSEDSKRYHSLEALKDSWHHQMFGLLNGSVSHAPLDPTLSIETALLSVKSEVKKLNSDADDKIQAAHLMGEKKAKGEFLGIKDAAKRGYEAVSEGFEEAARTAVSLAGGSPSPAVSTNLQGTLSSIYAAAARNTAASIYASADTPQSASSLRAGVLADAGSLVSAASSSAGEILAAATDAAPSLASMASGSVESLASLASSGILSAASGMSSALLPSKIQDALVDAQNSLRSAYAEASQTLLRAAGLQPSPTNVAQSASSALSQASDYLAELQAQASSLLISYSHAASVTLMSLAGQPSATGMQASAQSAYNLASTSAASYAESLAAEITSAASNAQFLIARIANDAYSALPDIPGTDVAATAYSDISSSVETQIHHATREALKAVGVSVTPDALREHVISAYSQASSAASSISASVLPSNDGIYNDISASVHSATRAAARAAGFTPAHEGPAEFAESVYDRASSVAASAASVVSEAIPTMPAASQVQRGAASALGEASASASWAVDAASSGVHQATRTVASALGADLTPEGVTEYAASFVSSISSIVSGATEVVRQRAEL